MLFILNIRFNIETLCIGHTRMVLHFFPKISRIFSDYFIRNLKRFLFKSKTFILFDWLQIYLIPRYSFCVRWNVLSFEYGKSFLCYLFYSLKEDGVEVYTANVRR